MNDGPVNSEITDQNVRAAAEKKGGNVIFLHGAKHSPKGLFGGGFNENVGISAYAKGGVGRHGLILHIGAAMLVAVFNQWFEIYQNKTPRKSWF